MREMYTYYIHSDAYAAMVEPKILPISCLSILERKFQGLWADTLFEDALVGKNCDVPLPHHPAAISSPLVNQSIRNIPLDDYIASTEVAGMLARFLETAFAVGPKWPSDHRETNLRAYILSTELSYKSACDHLDCRVFRKIVEQTHYQLSVMIKAGSARNKFDVFLPIDLLGELVKPLGQAIEESLATTAPPTSSIRQFFKCRFVCFRTTTTTTTTISPTNFARIQWDENHAKQTLQTFKKIADEKLDQHLLSLGRWALDNDSALQLQSMQTVFMPEIIGLTMCISTRPTEAIQGNTEALLQLVFDLLGDIEGAKSIADWPPIFDSARESIFTLRHTLQFLR